MGKIELTRAARAERAAYMREYRRKNRKKNVAAQARYWENRARQARAIFLEECDRNERKEAS